MLIFAKCPDDFSGIKEINDVEEFLLPWNWIIQAGMFSKATWIEIQPDIY